MQIDVNKKQSSHNSRFLLLLGLCYLPLIFLGYGSDSDTYGTLEMGRHLISTGQYVPSRFPGYPVFELIMAVAAPLGGSILTNLMSLSLGIWALHMLMQLLEKNTHLVWLVAVHPLFVILATSSHDSIWALAFTMASALNTIKNRPIRAGAWGGLAVATRLQYGPVILCFFLWGLWQNKSTIRRWLSLIIPLLGVVVAAYSLSAASVGWSLDFLFVGMGEDAYWTPLLKFGKFAYKNIYFWGLQALAVLMLFTIRQLVSKKRALTCRHSSEAMMFLGTILLTEAVFFCYPIEKAYLLPVLPFTALLMGRCLDPGHRWFVVMVVAVASFNFVTINIAQPDTPKAATGARLGLWVEPGELLNDIERRIVLRNVSTMEGYVDSLRVYRQRNNLPTDLELENLAQPPVSVKN